MNGGFSLSYQDCAGWLDLARNLCCRDLEPLHPQVVFDCQLRRSTANLTLGNPSSEAIDLLLKLGDSETCTNEVRAGAFFVLGAWELKKARERGDLVALWEERRSAVSADIRSARMFLSRGLELLGTSCSYLKRNVMRYFALSLGPDSDTGDCEYCAALVHASIGEATYLRSERSGAGVDFIRNKSIGQELFNVQDPDSQQCFFGDLAKNFDSSQRFVSLALCSSGELLVASIDILNGRVKHSVGCVFPKCRETPEIIEEVHSFKSVMFKNKTQLEAVLKIDARNREEKKRWWRERMELDGDLGFLLANFEEVILSSMSVQEVLFGHQAQTQNLCNRFEDAAERGSTSLHSISFEELRKKKVSELIDELVSRGREKKSLRGIRKAELIQTLLDDCQPQRTEHEDSRSSVSCIILDESLCSFPIEGIPSFRDKTVCRLPSLAFALNIKRTCGEERVVHYDPERTTYILDPETDLEETKTRIQPIVSEYDEMFNGSWRGLINEVPDTNFLCDALTTHEGVFCYFGHGGGKKYLTGPNSSKLVCPSVSVSMLLMGCSSVLLRSPNEPSVDVESPGSLLLDPEGIALSYLVAGAPCVVGCLWDVTDRDIDAYAETLMSLMYKDDECIPAAVSKSRDACKLRHLTGCSVVCYGFPVHSRNRK